MRKFFVCVLLQVTLLGAMDRELLDADKLLSETETFLNDSFDTQDFLGKRIEAIVSYKLLLTDSLPTNEYYGVSLAMRPSQANIAYECEIDIGDYGVNHDDSELLKLLRQEKEQVLECLQKSEIHLREYGLNKNFALTHKSILEIRPRRIYAYLYGNLLVVQVLDSKPKLARMAGFK